MLHQRRCTQRVMAYEREWPDREFISEVEEAFPDQGIANVEEARVGLLTSSQLHGMLDHRLFVPNDCADSCHNPQHKNLAQMLVFTCRHSSLASAGLTWMYGLNWRLRMWARSRLPSTFLVLTVPRNGTLSRARRSFRKRKTRLSLIW